MSTVLSHKLPGNISPLLRDNHHKSSLAMGRWTQYDEDSYRLPAGMVRVGYDADTGKYQFRDRDGSLWDGPLGSEYGTMVPGACRIDGSSSQRGLAPERFLQPAIAHCSTHQEVTRRTSGTTVRPRKSQGPARMKVPRQASDGPLSAIMFGRFRSSCGRGWKRHISRQMLCKSGQDRQYLTKHHSLRLQ
ncbi:hypothetical protein BV20DRAFT_974300 [Pilatotrama ljubarskyi]|nr:hypothetical protein BV20DRAFT_974300 [Pilatotrama ljubarskyi]